MWFPPSSPTWHVVLGVLVSWVKFSLVGLGRKESPPLLPPPLAPWALTAYPQYASCNLCGVELAPKSNSYITLKTATVHSAAHHVAWRSCAKRTFRPKTHLHMCAQLSDNCAQSDIFLCHSTQAKHGSYYKLQRYLQQLQPRIQASFCVSTATYLELQLVCALFRNWGHVPVPRSSAIHPCRRVHHPQVYVRQNYNHEHQKCKSEFSRGLDIPAGGQL